MLARIALPLVVCATTVVFSLTTYAVRTEKFESIRYDEPEPGKYRWNIVRLVWDTAPAPGTPGHDDTFPVHNSEGLNVPFMEHIHFAVTDSLVDPRSNSYADVLYTHYDFDETQIQVMNWNMTQLWATSSCYPIPIRIGNPSIVYNCFAYALGHSDKAINDIKYFTQALYFPSGVPDWRLLQSQEKPDRAAHGHKYEEHGSIVSQEMRYSTFWIYTYASEINVYTGKYGETGIYKSDGQQAPEYFTTPDTRNRKRKSS